MKANKVLKYLNITRPTLCKYVKTGKLKVTALVNGDYDYDDESVAEAMNGFKRRSVAVYYGNVPTARMKECQAAISEFKKTHFGENVVIYHDNDGISGKQFKQFVEDMMEHKIRLAAVLDGDYEVASKIAALSPVAAKCICKLEVLKCKSNGEYWVNENMDVLMNFVKIMQNNASNPNLKGKFECIEKILNM